VLRLFSFLGPKTSQIKNETVDAANTALRVGQALEDIKDSAIMAYDPAGSYVSGQLAIYEGTIVKAVGSVGAQQTPASNPEKWDRKLVVSTNQIAEGNYNPVSGHVLAQLIAEGEAGEGGTVPMADEDTAGISYRASDAEVDEGVKNDAYVSPYSLKGYLFRFYKDFVAPTLQAVTNVAAGTTNPITWLQPTTADTGGGFSGRKFNVGALLFNFGYIPGRGAVMQGPNGTHIAAIDHDGRFIYDDKSYAKGFVTTELPANTNASHVIVTRTVVEPNADGTTRTVYPQLPLTLDRLLELQAYTQNVAILNLFMEKLVDSADIGVFIKLGQKLSDAGFGGSGGGGSLSDEYLGAFIDWYTDRTAEGEPKGPKPVRPVNPTAVYVTRQYITGKNFVVEADTNGLQLKVVEDLNTGTTRDYTGSVGPWSLTADIPGITISQTGKLLVAEGSVSGDVSGLFAVVRIAEGLLDFPFTVQNTGCSRPAVGYLSPQLVYGYAGRLFESLDDAIITMRRHFAGTTSGSFIQTPAQMTSYAVGTTAWDGFGTSCAKAVNGFAYVLNGDGVNGQLLAIQISPGAIQAVKAASDVPTGTIPTVILQYIDHNNTGATSTAQIFEGAVATQFTVRERMSDNSVRNYVGTPTNWRFSAFIPGLTISSTGMARLAENSITAEVKDFFVQVEIATGSLDKRVVLTNTGGGTTPTTPSNVITNWQEVNAVTQLDFLSQQNNPGSGPVLTVNLPLKATTPVQIAMLYVGANESTRAYEDVAFLTPDGSGFIRHVKDLAFQSGGKVRIWIRNKATTEELLVIDSPTIPTSGVIARTTLFTV
jgi:hypothetical protein